MAPALLDREADYEIPARIWSTWIPSDGKREIVRALTPDERAIVDARAADLLACISPYERFEEDKAVAAIASMFGGFRSMRHGDEDAAAVLNGVRHVLAPFPLWAIERGCLLIQRGEASVDGKKLDRRFAPNDSEIYAVIKDIVKPYRQALANAQTLLVAPVESRS